MDTPGQKQAIDAVHTVQYGTVQYHHEQGAKHDPILAIYIHMGQGSYQKRVGDIYVCTHANCTAQSSKRTRPTGTKSLRCSPNNDDNSTYGVYLGKKETSQVAVEPITPRPPKPDLAPTKNKTPSEHAYHTHNTAKHPQQDTV